MRGRTREGTSGKCATERLASRCPRRGVGVRRASGREGLRKGDGSMIGFRY